MEKRLWLLHFQTNYINGDYRTRGEDRVGEAILEAPIVERRSIFSQFNMPLFTKNNNNNNLIDS